jgi:hypothetical protein
MRLLPSSDLFVLSGTNGTLEVAWDAVTSSVDVDTSGLGTGVPGTLTLRDIIVKVYDENYARIRTVNLNIDGSTSANRDIPKYNSATGTLVPLAERCYALIDGLPLAKKLQIQISAYAKFHDTAANTDTTGTVTQANKYLFPGGAPGVPVLTSVVRGTGTTLNIQAQWSAGSVGVEPKSIVFGFFAVNPATMVENYVTETIDLSAAQKTSRSITVTSSLLLPATSIGRLLTVYTITELSSNDLILSVESEPLTLELAGAPLQPQLSIVGNIQTLNASTTPSNDLLVFEVESGFGDPNDSTSEPTSFVIQYYDATTGWTNINSSTSLTSSTSYKKRYEYTDANTLVTLVAGTDYRFRAVVRASSGVSLNSEEVVMAWVQADQAVFEDFTIGVNTVTGAYVDENDIVRARITPGVWAPERVSSTIELYVNDVLVETRDVTDDSLTAVTGSTSFDVLFVDHQIDPSKDIVYVKYGDSGTYSSHVGAALEHSQPGSSFDDTTWNSNQAVIQATYVLAPSKIINHSVLYRTENEVAVLVKTDLTQGEITDFDVSYSDTLGGLATGTALTVDETHHYGDTYVLTARITGAWTINEPVYLRIIPTNTYYTGDNYDSPLPFYYTGPLNTVPNFTGDAVYSVRSGNDTAGYTINVIITALLNNTTYGKLSGLRLRSLPELDIMKRLQLSDGKVDLEHNTVSFDFDIQVRTALGEEYGIFVDTTYSKNGNDKTSDPKLITLKVVEKPAMSHVRSYNNANDNTWHTVVEIDDKSDTVLEALLYFLPAVDDTVLQTSDYRFTLASSASTFVLNSAIKKTVISPHITQYDIKHVVSPAIVDGETAYLAFATNATGSTVLESPGFTKLVGVPDRRVL